MEQLKTVEYGSQKASPDILKPCYIYVCVCVCVCVCFLHKVKARVRAVKALSDVEV